MLKTISSAWEQSKIHMNASRIFENGNMLPRFRVSSWWRIRFLHSFELFDNIRHIRPILMFMCPHVLHEFHDLRTPLFCQGSDRWTLLFCPNNLVDGMLIHTLGRAFSSRLVVIELCLTSQGNFFSLACHCKISQNTIAQEKTSTL